MTIISGIYQITSPSNKIYIGLSRNIYNRWDAYKHICNSKSQTLLHKSFKKYGVDNHIFEILEEVDDSLLSEREIFWIDKKQSHLRGIGLNISLGGNFPPKQYKPKTEEHKRKISIANTGRKHSKESIQKIKDARKKQIFTPEQNKKRAARLIGVPSKLRGRKRPNISEKLRGRLSPISITCKLINVNDNTEIIAGSIQELSRKSGVSVTSILNIRKGNPPKKFKHFKYEQ